MAREEQFKKFAAKVEAEIPVVQHSTLQCLCLEQVACPRTRIQQTLRVIQTRTALLRQYYQIQIVHLKSAVPPQVPVLALTTVNILSSAPSSCCLLVH